MGPDLGSNLYHDAHQLPLLCKGPISEVNPVSLLLPSRFEGGLVEALSTKKLTGFPYPICRNKNSTGPRNVHKVDQH